MKRFIVKYINAKGEVVTIDVYSTDLVSAEREAIVRRKNDIKHILSIWKVANE